jgi:hypothetical protein
MLMLAKSRWLRRPLTPHTLQLARDSATSRRRWSQLRGEKRRNRNSDADADSARQPRIDPQRRPQDQTVDEPGGLD